MISITFDTEWSPDPIIADTISLLDQYGVDATLFSTHRDGVTAEGHERGLHPNFIGESSSDPEVLADISNKFPEATGLRSHSMYVHSPLRQHYETHGIRYESNYMQYLVEDLRPFWLYGGIIQLPVYFMDDMWLRTRGQKSSLPDVSSLLESDGLKVLDFHPIHVFLNTPSIEYYEQHRDNYQDPVALQKERASGLGVRDLFIALLEFISNNNIDTAPLGDIASEFEETNPYQNIRL